MRNVILFAIITLASGGTLKMCRDGPASHTPIPERTPGHGLRLEEGNRDSNLKSGSTKIDSKLSIVGGGARRGFLDYDNGYDLHRDVGVGHIAPKLRNNPTHEALPTTRGGTEKHPRIRSGPDARIQPRQDTDGGDIIVIHQHEHYHEQVGTEERRGGHGGGHGPTLKDACKKKGLSVCYQGKLRGFCCTVG